MKYYFGLQFRILNRSLRDFGLHPIVGYLLMAAAFVGLSLYLFSTTEFAEYLIILLAISTLLKQSETRRNDFLKSCFSLKSYFKIRLIENILLALPFLILLIFKDCYLSAAVLIPVSIMLAFLNFENKFQITLPTPFYRRPFEFIIGFRNTFYIFFFSYFLTFMAISVGNFNLGIFALILVFVVCFTFYTSPENDFFVWIYASGPKGFLFDKIKIALLHSTILSLPIVVSLGIFFTANLDAILAFQALGYLYLTTVVLAKYSAFPDKMNLPQGFLLAFSLWLPPLLVGVIPYFYSLSIRRLNEILE